MENPTFSRLKLVAYGDLLKAMKESKHQANRREFADILWEHLKRLPTRYALEVKTPDDVITHLNLLKLPAPAFEVRSVPGESSAQNTNNPWMNKHEIIFSRIDDAKLLCQLKSMISELGLNLLHDRTYSTVDGLSLDILIVNGWSQGTEILKAALTDQIMKQMVSTMHDSPLESLRRHLSAICSERIFQILQHRVESDTYVSSSILNLASFSQKRKFSAMKWLLYQQPQPSLEYTHSRRMARKMAALSFAKATATISVAGIFSMLAVVTEIVPAISDKKKLEKKFEIFGQTLNEKIVEGYDAAYGKFQKLLKNNSDSNDARFKSLETEVSTLHTQVKILQEALSKKKGGSGWFPWSR